MGKSEREGEKEREKEANYKHVRYTKTFN